MSGELQRAPEASSVAAEADVTRDTLLRGRVRLIQPTRGFRSSLDPVLLASFVAPPYGRFVDIGCGTGAVGFLLLARDPQARGLGIEIQERLAALAARGTVENGFSQRFEVRCADVRRFVHREPVDLVVSNPPYRPVGTGVLPSDRERALANHEVTLTLSGWLDATAALLAPTGRLAVVFPADRLEELVAGMAMRGLQPARVRMVVSQMGEPPRRVLVEGRRADGSKPETLPALIVHDGTGFTPEVRRMLGEADE